MLLPVLPPTAETHATLPAAAATETTGPFAAAAAAWLAAAPLREFEAHSALPLFPVRTIYPEGIVPPGFQVRIQAETMRACGGSYLTLAAAGVSPYIAEPFLKICEKHRDQLADWAEDALELALEKWGGAD